MNYAKHLQNHALARSKLDARVDRHIVQRDDSSFIDVLAYVVFASQSDSWLASAQRDPEWLSNSLLDDPLAGGARDAGNTNDTGDDASNDAGDNARDTNNGTGDGAGAGGGSGAASNASGADGDTAGANGNAASADGEVLRYWHIYH